MASELEPHVPKHQPVVPADVRLPEITVKAIILGILLALILAAANAYLGLFAGMTVSASIPAAVISMTIFSFFKKSNILENNIVQTAASAGEAVAAAAVFTIPGLVILGSWKDYSYWHTFLICAVGGTIGVLFSVPLRRALVVRGGEEIKFPEGIATAEVLKAGQHEEKGSLGTIVTSGIVGGVLKLCQDAGLNLWSSALELGARVGGSVAYVGAIFPPRSWAWGTSSDSIRPSSCSWEAPSRGGSPSRRTPHSTASRPMGPPSTPRRLALEGPDPLPGRGRHVRWRVLGAHPAEDPARGRRSQRAHGFQEPEEGGAVERHGPGHPHDLGPRVHGPFGDPPVHRVLLRCEGRRSRPGHGRDHAHRGLPLRGGGGLHGRPRGLVQQPHLGGDHLHHPLRFPGPTVLHGTRQSSGARRGHPHRGGGVLRGLHLRGQLAGPEGGATS